MRNILKTLFILAAVLFSFQGLQAQSKTTTIILLRHAEKETADPAMAGDPYLSKAGQTRAENLVLTLADYNVDAVYSTNYNRTKSTVTPLAGKYKLDIQSYDPRNQKPFAEQLKAMEGKTIVVVGHSNTIPALVNLLADAPGKYADLDESIYNKLYIVKITDGVPTVEIREY